MRTAETISALTKFESRGAGTDAERRAGLWLAGFWGLLAAVGVLLLGKIAYLRARQDFLPNYLGNIGIPIELVPELRESFSVGERVIVAGRDMAIELTPSGEERLTDRDTALIRNSWQ